MSRRARRRRPIADINVVPYIDVMLVLLVVFMVTAPLLMQGVKVELPDAPAEPLKQQSEEPLIVSIKADGSYYLNMGKAQDKAASIDSIADRVAKVMRNKPETQVLVWGDEAVPYGKVIELMTRLQQAGARSVGMVTESTPDAKS